MQHNHEQFVNAAMRRASRVRRNTGRIFFSALGFGLAYLYDPERGGARRERLRGSLRRAAATRYSVVAPVAEVDDSLPVFHPLLRGLGVDGYARNRQRSRAS